MLDSNSQPCYGRPPAFCGERAHCRGGLGTQIPHGLGGVHIRGATPGTPCPRWQQMAAWWGAPRQRGGRHLGAWALAKLQLSGSRMSLSCPGWGGGEETTKE